jgi:anti-anti-sigma factor
MARTDSQRQDALDTIEVRVYPRASLISLVGEHDLSTRGLLFDAVARAAERPRLVVDLTECSFLDSCILGVLFSAHSQCERMAIVLPDAGSIVHRTIAMTGVRTLIPVFATIEEAFRSVAEPGWRATPGLARPIGRTS